MHGVRPSYVKRQYATRTTAYSTLASRALQELGGDLAFPLVEHQTLVGIIVVGPKRSGDAYFADDIGLLETLLSQAGHGHENAQLYKEVVLVDRYLDEYTFHDG